MLPTVKMNETKLEINENYEEADLSDVEDDVFVRSGGRNGYRLEYDTAKKPLMTPRKKHYNFDGIKNGGFHTDVRSSTPVYRIICVPMCYIIIATLAMLGIIAAVIFLMGHIKWPLGVSKLWAKSKVLEKLLPCDNIMVDDVWVRHYPKLLTESSFRTADVNQDGTDDIIFGYATGADGLDVPAFVCDIYFSGQKPCFGGVLALNGKDGSEIWRHWTAHEVYAINCNEDLNKDGIKDCLVAGRAGVFCAINGKDGTLIWTFEDGPAKNPLMNVYTPQFVRDLNGDGIPDILAIHGGDPLAEAGSPTRLPGRILIFSGKNGEVLQFVATPDQRESYYSPQILTREQDGTDYVLFGTGGETHGGGLYVILLSDLYKGLIDNAQLLYKDEAKGIMVPPVITDINQDGTDDIVMAMFNSTVVAFDGLSFKQIWNHTFPSAETYTTPTPGFFNGDEIPDFLVKYQVGPGFPVYYHAQTILLDGKTGKQLMEEPIIDSIGSQASTPLIRVEGLGNDIFLYWSSNCKGYEGNSTEFAFVKGTNIHEQSRSDFCKLRFDAKLLNQLRGFNRKIGVPGTIVYDSDARSADEYNMTVNTSEEGQAYLRAHPEMWKYFGGQDTQDSKKQDTKETGYLPPSSAAEFDQIGPVLDPYAGLSSPDFQGLNQQLNVPGNPYLQYPAQGMYDIPSQPELTEDVKYPVFHNVRKHGKYQLPPNPNNLDPPLNINVNRRGHEARAPEGAFGNNYYPYGAQLEAARTNDYLNPGAYYPYQAPQTGNGPALKRYRRVKRHVGPHDNDGIQRLISTGTLAPPLNEKSDGIDLIFATYWFYPAKTQIVSKERDCIQEKLARAEGKPVKDKYSGTDDDQYDDVIRRECFGEGISESTDDDGRTYDSQTSYNPFDIHMGQMSVYRLHISCNCTMNNAKKSPHERCANILPFEKQAWSGYMGSRANSYFPKINIGEELLRLVTPA